MSLDHDFIIPKSNGPCKVVGHESLRVEVHDAHDGVAEKGLS